MDENSKSSKIKRYSSVGSTMANVGLRAIASKITGNDAMSPAVITSLIGNLKGPAMKIAQFLSTVPGAMPEEYSKELSSLQSSAPPMGPLFVKRRMKMALGDKWMDNFNDFDEKSFASASLGQVHKATLKNNDIVACKLQYPDMESIIEADISQLKLFLSIYKKTIGAIDTKEIQEEISEKLMEEVDYINESKNIKIYKKIFEDNDNYSIPKVYDDLSTQKLLVMEYLEGNHIFDEINDKKDVASKLFYAWYNPLYSSGIIHGDPHPGNYTVRKDGGINLLDFGCVRKFSPDFVESVLLLYKSHRDNDMDLAYVAYKNWGFESLSKEIFEVMNHWAKFLFEPLLDNKVRLIQSDSSKGWNIASKVHEELKKKGGIKPPKEFVFMDRAAVGIGSVMMRLGVELDWHELFESIVENFDKNSIKTDL